MEPNNDENKTKLTRELRNNLLSPYSEQADTLFNLKEKSVAQYNKC